MSKIRNVVVVEGVLIPPANETEWGSNTSAKHDVKHDSRDEMEHKCREFSADEITSDFVNDIQGKPVLDNHCQDLVVGHVHSAQFTESKLVMVVVMLYPDTEAGKNAINKLRSGEYSGFSAFHRFKVYQYPNGTQECVKSQILEVSVCKKGRRNGTYVVRVGKNEIPQKEAISALVKSGEVFASENMDVIDIKDASAKTTVEIKYNTNDIDADIKGDSSAFPTAPQTDSGLLKKVESETKMSDESLDTTKDVTVCPEETAPQVNVTTDAAIEPQGGEIEIVIDKVEETSTRVQAEEHIAPEPSAPATEPEPEINTTAAILKEVKETMAKQKAENDALKKELAETRETLDKAHTDDKLRIENKKREEEERFVKNLETNIEALGYDPAISKSITSLPKDTVQEMNQFVSHIVKEKNNWVAEKRELGEVKNKYKQVKTELESLHTMLGPQPNTIPRTTCGQEKRNLEKMQMQPANEQIGECAMSLHPGKKAKLSEEEMIRGMYKNKEIDWNQWMDMTSDLMKKEHMATISSGSMAASAGEDGGFVSEGYNKDLDMVSQHESQLSGMALPGDALQLCGPSLRHHNKPEFDKIMKNLRSIHQMSSTHQIGEMNMADIKRSSFATSF